MCDALNLSRDDALVLWASVVPPKHNEPAMVPGRVVPHIFLQQLLHRLDFCFVPKVEPFDQPLPVAPYMIVLRVLIEHLLKELSLTLGGAQLLDDRSPVM